MSMIQQTSFLISDEGQIQIKNSLITPEILQNSDKNQFWESDGT